MRRVGYRLIIPSSLSVASTDVDVAFVVLGRTLTLTNSVESCLPFVFARPIRADIPARRDAPIHQPREASRMSLRTNVSALSSLALAVTAGCVSQSQYNKVIAERD